MVAVLVAPSDDDGAARGDCCCCAPGFLAWTPKERGSAEHHGDHLLLSPEHPTSTILAGDDEGASEMRGVAAAGMEVAVAAVAAVEEHAAGVTAVLVVSAVAGADDEGGDAHLPGM